MAYPFDFDEPFLADPARAMERVLAAQRRSQSPVQPFPLEQEESLLTAVTNNALGGLGYLGKTLDKTFGGRAVRGVLGGKPREALSILPFSDTLGITDENDVVYGREFLAHHGLATPNDPNAWEVADLAGFGAEVLLDPSLYLTFGSGALTKAGLGALKGGTLAKGLAPKIAAGQAGLLGVGLPFRPPAAVLGTGPTAQRVAGAVDRAADWLKGTAPVRYGRALFDPVVDRATTKEVQDLAAGVKRPAEDRMMAEVLGTAYDYRHEIEDLIQRQEPEVLRYLLRQAEGVPVPGTWQDFIADLQTRDPLRYQELLNNNQLGNLQGQFPRMQDIGHRLRGQFAQTRTAENALGIPTPELQDSGLAYVMRRALPLEGRKPGETTLQSFLRQVQRTLDTGHSSQMARDELLRGFPEGTAQINDLVRMRDPATGQPLLVGEGRLFTDLQAEELLRRQLTMQPGVPGTGIGDITQVAPEVTEQARALARWMKGLDPRYALEQRNFFDPDIVSNLAVRGAKGAKVRSSAEAILEGVKRFSRPVSDFTDDRLVKVPELLREAGLTHTGPTGARVAEELAARALGLRDVSELTNMALPKDVARDLTRWLQGWTRPDELNPVLAAFDATSNLFKGWVTSPFPAFHVRNAVTGLYNMWRDDALDLSAIKDALDVLQGRPIAPLPGMASTGPQQVLSDVVREAASQRVAFTRGSRQTGDILQTAVGDLPRLTHDLPGKVYHRPEVVFERLAGAARPLAEVAGDPHALTARQLLSQVGLDTPNDLQAVLQRMGLQSAADLDNLAIPGARLPDVLGKSAGEAATDWARGFLPEKGKALEQLLDPTAVAGVRTEKDVNRVMRQMRQVGDTTENWMRLAHYIAKRRQGFVPEEAAKAVTKYHFNYADVTPFERGVMKRFVPFYTYSRKNLPPILEDLATRPGKLSATVRAGTGAAREGEMFVPEYLGEGVAVPLPGAPEGQQRFLSSFGLPVEDEMLKATGSLLHGDPSRAARHLLSGITPIAKLPVEMATGVQLHSGRNLADLRPTGLGSAFGLLSDEYAHPVSQILANTPATRFATVLDKLVDERKGPLEKFLNLGTGARVTDVDMERQREIAAQNVINSFLRGRAGVGHLETLFVKPENVPLLSPAELELLRLQKGLERRSRERAKTQKRTG